MKDKIVIKGARAHNLKNVDLTIPRDQLVVFTGVSGSGKSSLAFDTIYAEGQRRYVESLSSYARQFLGQMEKPDVDLIEGLSPAISIDQKTTSHNPRSTVGTVTEIYDYLRLLYARIGIPHCPKCGKEIKKQTIDQIVDRIMELPERTKLQLLAPVVRGRKGEHVKLLEDAKKSGYVRVRVDGILYDLSEKIELEKNKKHNIEIVVDRPMVKEGMQMRLTESIETASALSGGLLIVDVNQGEDELLFSQSFSCPDCGVDLMEIEPRMFSFNNPSGACPTCTGLGMQMKFDEQLIVPNEELSIMQGAITAPGYNSVNAKGSMSKVLFDALAAKYGFSLETPFKDLPRKIKDIIFYGTKEKLRITYSNVRGTGTYDYAFEGVINTLRRRYNETSEAMRAEFEEYMTNIECPDCHGKRLRPEVLAITVNGKNISEVTELSIGKMQEFFQSLTLTERENMIAERILKEIHARVGFLIDVGLEYLTLSRTAGTLSGGESQRIRLATQIGSGLVGVVYILDEPSIGLHQRDNDKLLATLKHLRDIGNSLIVVEHDEDTMRAADFVVDIGPGAGRGGGEIVAAGSVEEIMAVERSVTGAYLSGRKKIEVPKERRPFVQDHKLVIRGAAENNLKNINVEIPLGVFTCVTGVSGSGKSSLINEILYKRLAKELNRAKTRAGRHEEMLGLEKLDKVINIDQSPIGRTPRSNPATYTGLFDMIRDVFAQTTEAKVRGYQKGRFSFNVKGGRCEACSGDGIVKIEMHFLPDIYVPCEVCHGKRYNRETLEVKYKGKTISDVLDMTVEEALQFFENIPRIKNKLQTLYDVGLSYVQLGQSSTTLSGGEAQRVKLATELSRKSTGKTVYILDEPTTGLHTADVHKLVQILQRLTEGGNTVIVIEHNLDVIKTADYIIDLGPEGGDGGGTIVAVGTPEEICRVPASYTGKYLKPLLDAKAETSRKPDFD
ncbi:excinuclease ABC subunit UvrA [Anaerotignum faecicola]|uniref:UvrABC system protein A n=1 Tax=Anaerotignum faecicola TaxID=2358141 RepID=A0A401LAD3_9FIRM|nr:excinuclease ABC subunit UvrA [Anaerotignum faecicola]GCB28440.1 UvrABC system protein A [Anaerotignum faecicola]